MTEQPRNPFHGTCRECDHVFVVLYLPMELTKAAMAMQRATCPMCGSTQIDCGGHPGTVLTPPPCGAA